MHIKTLDDYFSDKALVKKLCARRIKVAQRNRRSNFYSSVAGLPSQVIDDGLREILPPRRLWRKFRPPPEFRALPPEQLRRLLVHRFSSFVVREAQRPTHKWSWAENLRKFLDDTRHKALNWTRGTGYTPSKITPKPKGEGKYRVLAEYGLVETLICAGFSSYLRDIVDTRLSASVQAFRTPKGPQELAPHSIAFQHVVEYQRQIAPWKDIWVAECDIQAFFDSVSHDLVRERVQEITAASNADTRLYAFLSDFLEGYDYANARLRALNVLGSSAEVKDVETLLRAEFPTPAPACFGIPQGSFMSCILANIVLERGDRACLEALGERGSLYLRYCDDILIASISQRRCTAAMNAYIAALREMHLPVHPPGPAGVYAKAHWSKKSKSPYRWSCATGPGCVPWIGFVGYQLRRDGIVRIRKSSSVKQKEKHKHIYIQLKRQLKRKTASNTILRSSKSQMKQRVLMHLAAISVGYPRGRDHLRPAPGSICWTAGFDLMSKSSGRKALNDLRALDRDRANTYIRCAKLIDQLPDTMFAPKPNTTGAGAGTQARRSRRIKYLGAPFSYYHQFSSARAPTTETRDRTKTCVAALVCDIARMLRRHSIHRKRDS